MSPFISVPFVCNVFLSLYRIWVAAVVRFLSKKGVFWCCHGGHSFDQLWSTKHFNDIRYFSNTKNDFRTNSLPHISTQPSLQNASLVFHQIQSHSLAIYIQTLLHLVRNAFYQAQNPILCESRKNFHVTYIRISVLESVSHNPLAKIVCLCNRQVLFKHIRFDFDVYSFFVYLIRPYLIYYVWTCFVWLATSRTDERWLTGITFVFCSADKVTWLINDFFYACT